MHRKYAQYKQKGAENVFREVHEIVVHFKIDVRWITVSKLKHVIAKWYNPYLRVSVSLSVYIGM